MHDYVTSETYYFKEIGQKVPAGQTVTLRKGDADRYMMSHPGLLKPARLTTQGEVRMVRAAPVAEPAAEVTPAPVEPTPVIEPTPPVVESTEPVAPTDEPTPTAPVAETPRATRKKK